MGAQLRGVEVYYSYHDERFHIHLPATLSPIIGKQGVLQCRLDSVRRPGMAAPVARTDTFDASFSADRRLTIPSTLANNCGIVGGSTLDVSVLTHLTEQSGWFRRRTLSSPIYPNDTVIFDNRDAAASRFGTPSFASGQAPSAFGEAQQPPLSPWQLARSIERELAKPMQAAPMPRAPQPPPQPAPMPAPPPAAASTDDEAADRKRWLEILHLYHAAKEGRVVVDNTRGIGIVPPEQPFRRARNG